MKIIKRKHIKLTGIETIAILADCGCARDWEKNFPRLLEHVWKKHTPELFLVAGDIALTGHYNDYRNMLKYFKKIPSSLIAIPGNHDRPLILFRRFFGSVHKVIDVENWRFICANTANKSFTKNESQWIQNKIINRSIIITHVPPKIEGWSFYSLSADSSNRLFELVRKNHSKITAMFFGHIHGFSVKTYMGIPVTLTGCASQSKIIENNQYNEETSVGLTIFKVSTGRTEICKLV